MIDFLPTLFLPSDPLLPRYLLLVLSCADVSPSCTPLSFINAYFESLVVGFWDFAFVRTYTLYVYVPGLMLPHMNGQAAQIAKDLE